MSVVDAHHHLWDLTANPLPWLEGKGENPLRRDFLVDDLLAELDGAGIAQTVCVQAGDTLSEARWLFDQGGAGSPLAGVVAQADVGGADFEETLTELAAYQGSVPLVGLRDPTLARRFAQGVTDTWSAGLSVLGRIGLPLELLTRDGSLGAVPRLAAEHPGQVFVVDHLGQPPVESRELTRWAADLTAVAELDNVNCKLSALRLEWASSHARELQFVVGLAFDAFGPSRLMFGSDWPVSPPTGGYRDTLQMISDLVPQLSSAEADSVWGGTARRVYGL